jgi:hypothetical protein
MNRLKLLRCVGPLRAGHFGLRAHVVVTEARNDWLEGALWHRSMVPDRERHRPGAESEIDEVKESDVLVVTGENSLAERQ